MGVVWYIPVCRFVDQEWFGAENVNAGECMLVQKVSSYRLPTTSHIMLVSKMQFSDLCLINIRFFSLNPKQKGSTGTGEGLLALLAAFIVDK